jgi:nucleoside transporter
MDNSLRFRLGAMMFLQYAIWGAWNPVLGQYVSTLKFSGVETGHLYNTLPLACMIAPFIGGQLADRYFPTQYVLAGLHLLGGVALLLTAGQTSFYPMLIFLLIFSFLYAPTLALTNSISFKNMENTEKEFGGIRVWGTIGWIVVGILLALWLKSDEAVPKILSVLPIPNPFYYLRSILPFTPHQSDCLRLGGIAALLLGVFSLFLPHTPPNKEGSNPLAFVEAFRLLRDKNFAFFMIIAFVVSTELMFYYMLTAEFLASPQIGVPATDTSAIMTIGQIAEIVTMAIALPILLPKLGVRKCLAIGIIAWPIRYIIFAIGGPSWLVIASLALHGFCYVFFFTVSQVYVDNVAPPDIRASAQSLVALITLGLGLYVGGLFAGKVKDVFTANSVINWQNVFIVPCVLTIVCLVAFLTTFREPAKAMQKGVTAA